VSNPYCLPGRSPNGIATKGESGVGAEGKEQQAAILIAIGNLSEFL
jgi:hypothetical protein